MHSSLQTVVRSCLVLLIATSAGAATLRPTGRAVPGELLVKIRPGASQGATESILAEAGEGQRLTTVGSGTIWRMRSRGKSAEALAAALETNPNVVYAEPNYIVSVASTPNDLFFPDQWALKNTGWWAGGFPGRVGSDIDVEPAWGVTTGSASIVIGVVDTGVDYTHLDLAANMWSNPGGKGNAACAAGTHGFNAINGTCDPMDDHLHGTHVAGIIGAAGNNGRGVSGVNWTTSMMALKFLGANGYGTLADAITAIEFAVQAKIDGVNVRVLSNSWAGGGFSQALLDEIHRANEHDILFVAAAGNSGRNNDLTPEYPSSYPAANIISVAASDSFDDLAWFSNYGKGSVHLGAPGVMVLSTIPSAYLMLDGTSMATPQVSGVAGLLLASAPGLSTAAVKSAILNNVDVVPGMVGKTITNGRLNAAKVLGATPSPQFSIALNASTRTVTRGLSTPFTVTITRSGGFTGSVDLSVSGLPAGTTGTFSPNPATTTSTLTITTDQTAPIISQNLAIRGIHSTTTSLVSLKLSIVATQPPSACPAFHTAANYPGEKPASVATGDFNRDGRQDVAVAYVNTNEIAVRLGNANGTLQPAVAYGAGTAPAHVATGDFDADGKLDLAVANSGSSDVSILLGNGDGTFDAKIDSAAGTGPLAVAVGDFNNDGRSDLAVANEVSNNVSVLIGAGDGTFAAAVSYATGSGPSHLVVADFDRNSRADLAVAAHESDQVSVLLGNGDGTFAAAVHHAAGDGPSSLAAGDLNDDGRPDLVVSNESSSTLSFLLASGDGTFAPAVHRATGESLRSVVITRVDHDAVSDLIATNGQSNSVVVLLGAGGIQYPEEIPLTVGFEPNQLGVADFNGDGRADFVVANGGSDSISVVLNNSVCTAFCGVFAAPANYIVGGAAYSIAGGDFNRDGKMDVASASRGTNAVSVLLGNGDGTMTAGVVAGVGTNPDAIAAADLNRDGMLDLVTANSGSGNVSILMGNGNGTFQAAVNVSAGSAPRSVAAADFNRDGKTDLAVATSASSSVAILLGNGDGTFAAPASVSAGTGAFSAMPGDFNRDGRLDLAVANYGGDDVSILLGNGNGTFQAASNMAAGFLPRSVAVHDLDRNGTLDLAVANQGSSNISVFLGLGDGTFQAAVQHAAGGEGPFHVTAGDVTEEGFPDLLVSNNANGGFKVLTGGGNGSFSIASGYASGGLPGPAGTVVADFDRDGKPDVAVTHGGGGNVAILRNSCPAPDVTVTKTHTDAFAQGSMARTYNIEVRNSGQLPTSGLVTMTDLLPPELTANSLFGAPGWTCTLATVTCTRGNPMEAGTWWSFTLTVNVAAGAPATVTNVVKVSGGGEMNFDNNTASDPTTITPIPDPMVLSSHTGSFRQGATGNQYSLRVRNVGGLPTSGVVTVTDTLPSGLTATAISGPGWNCTLGSRSCNRSDVLASGASYPPITLTVSVAADAPSSVINTVTVSGGGDGNANNNFAQDATVVWAAATCGTFGAPAGYSAGADGAPFSVVAGNFNHDGKSDLAVTNFYSGNVSVLLGKPDGTFQDAVTYPAGNQPGAVAIGHLTNDLNPDLVIANYSAGTVSVLLGTGTGAFKPPVAYAVGAQPAGIAIGDFNGDGRSDVAVTNSASETVSILLGNGNGLLLSQVIYPAGSDPRALDVSDFDGNGTSDLVVSRGPNNVVAVLFGAGDGTFGAAVTYPVSGGSSAVAAADFDQDGKRDLAVLSSGNGSVGILLGNGNGTFQSAVYYDAAFNSATMVAEDLNGDGKTDLLMGSNGNFSTLLGNGDGTFDPVVIRYVAGAGAPLAIGDFNADGRPDAAFASQFESRAIVLLGGCVPDLTIAKSHSGTFVQGEVGRTYTIVVSNSGGAPTSGMVSVSDVLPAGLVATDLSGTGWSCTLQSCSRSDVLAPQASYPPIAMTVNVQSNAPATLVNSATVSGGGDPNSGNNTAADSTNILTTPANLMATATSGTQVSVTWDASLHATAYQIDRRSGNGPFQWLGSPASNAFSDATVTPGTTYLYRVRALADGAQTGFGNVDVATTIVFTGGPRIQAAHVTELRAAAAAMRTAAGLPAAVFTDPALTFVKAVHWTELRARIDEARSALGLGGVGYSALAAGTRVQAVHLQELRGAVQ